MTEHQAAEPIVEMTGRSSVIDGELRVDYRLENKGATPVYVWDQLVGHDDRGAMLDENTAYVAWEPARTVRLVRALLRLPEDFSVGKRSEPYVRVIPPASAISGRVRLTLPLREFNPYYPPGESLESVQCDDLLLIIGWIEKKEGMELRPRVCNGQKVYALGGGWAQPLQRFAKANFDTNVTLMTYTTPFDRRLPLE
jgi:hypothetical protein